MASLFLRQFWALLRRNLLIKRRKWRQLIFELAVPLYFTAILGAVKLGVQPDRKPEILTPPCWDQKVIPVPFRTATNQTLLFSPNTSTEVQAVMARVAALIGTTHVIGFPNASDVIAYYGSASEAAAGAVTFNNVVDGQIPTTYDLRFDSDATAIPKTSERFLGNDGFCREPGSLARGTPTNTFKCPTLGLLSSGLMQVQWAVDAAITQMTADANEFNNYTIPDVQSCFMPKASFLPSAVQLQTLTAIYMVIAYAPMVSILLSHLVTEKEKKIKIGMQMMGLSDLALWLAWFVTYVIVMAAASVIVIVLSLAFKLYVPSNLFLVFLMLFLYSLSVIAFAFALVPFFSKATVASAAGALSTMAFSLLYLLVASVETSTGVKWFLTIFSPTALGLGLGEVVLLNAIGDGLTFDNLSTANVTFPVRGAFIMLFVDTILYFLLALYFDRVIPDEFGRSWSPIFFLKPSFYRSCWGGHRGFQRLRVDAETGATASYGATGNTVQISEPARPVEPLPEDENVERVPSYKQGKEAIQVRHMRKVYSKNRLLKWMSNEKAADVVAVDDVSMDVYEGEITALLGHNGAGKSTLINILTGMVEPSSGSATFYGLDISDPHELHTIRQFTGVCPQHDILYDELTVREHLLLYARIKGVPGDTEEAEVERIIEKVTLSEKTNSLATTLSGGQKRKLSVGIALIGDPKIVFLDEPTSGMDPYSRRQLWGLLKESRKNRIIFLTTHFMDEADILADRKSILSKGLVRCAGSSVFLKSRFGIGYNLSMVTDGSCDTDAVKSEVTEHVSGAAMGRSHGKELSFRLPQDQSSSFPDLFQALEDEGSGRPLAEQLGIQSYGVSMTTLEEVFLKLGEDEKIEKEDRAKTSKETAPGNTLELASPLLSGAPGGEDLDEDDGEDASESNPLDRKLTNEGVETVTDEWQLLWQQFRAIIWIRLLYTIRNKKAVFYQFVLPPIFIIIGIVLASNVKNTSNVQSSLGLTPDIYFSNDAPCTNTPKGSSRVLFTDTGMDPNSSSLLPHFAALGVESCVVQQATNFSLFAIRNVSHSGAVQLYRNASDNDTLTHRVMGNSTATFSLPVLANLLWSAVLRSVSGKGNASISASLVPLPPRNPKLSLNTSLYTAIFLIGLGFTNVITAYVGNLVEDKEVHAKHQLLVSGLSRKVYYTSMIGFNLCIYISLVVVLLIIIGALGVDSFTTGGAFLSLVIISLLSAFCVNVWSALLSFAFSKRKSVENILPTFLIFGIMIPFFGVAVVDQLGYYSTARIIHYISCLVDAPYCFPGALYYIDRVYRIDSLGVGGKSVSDYFIFSANITGTILLIIGQMVVYTLLMVFIETRDARAAKKVGRGREVDMGEDPDSDVKDEVQRAADYVPDTENENDILVIRNLRKEFKPGNQACVPKERRKPTKVAVNGVNLVVSQGEVLGFLGPNGAGKTTTMNVVTGDIIPDEGEVFLNGQNVLGLAGSRQALGYCPQVDALWKDITLEEHMKCYALIKGVPMDVVDGVVAEFIKTMDIEEHGKKPAKELSGGTKRKASFAMSMLGTTHIVLLDEPSTGLDPSSKRFLWSVISNSIQGKRAAILTTHSMEEADALCSRVGIITNGTLQCIGSTQHLKSKHGGHYQLDVKLSTTAEGSLSDRMDGLKSFITDKFAGAAVLEEFSERALFKIPLDTLCKLSVAFAAMESTREKFMVEEYSLSQASLEQVFLNFAKKQG